MIDVGGAGVLDPGTLDTFLTIERATTTADGHGGHVTTWAAIAQFWAAVVPIGGREALQGMVRRDVVSHRVQCWFRTDLQATDRLQGDGRTFEIVSVRTLGRRLALELDVLEAPA